MTCGPLCIPECDIQPPPLPSWMTDTIFQDLVKTCPSWNIYQKVCLGIEGSNLTPSIEPIVTAETGSLWWISLIVLFFAAITILILVYLNKKNKLTKIACIARVSTPLDDSRSHNNGSCGSQDKMAMEERDGAIQGEQNARVLDTSLLSGLDKPVYYNKIRGHNDYVDIDPYRGADTNKGKSLYIDDNNLAVSHLSPIASMTHEFATDDVNSSSGANANSHNEDNARDDLHDTSVVPRVPYNLPPLIFHHESESRNRSKKKKKRSVNETPLVV